MFIREPEAFASFRDELIFEYAQEEISDLVFEIELEGVDEDQEVKKLYDASGATINIASIVANKFMTTPSSGESALETPERGYGLVKLKCDEVESQEQYYVAARVPLPEVGILSAMSRSRVISYGEAEEIWIRAEEGATIEVKVEATDEGGMESLSLEHTVDECGFARFRFNTTDFGAYTKTATIEVWCDSESLGVVSYYYVPAVRGAVRMAWIGSYGGVEHYTFPVTNTLTKMKDGVRQYEIESAYEPQSIVDELAEMLSSQRVWIVEQGEYIEVVMLSEFLVLNKNGVLSTVEYKIERYD